MTQRSPFPLPPQMHTPADWYGFWAAFWSGAFRPWFYAMQPFAKTGQITAEVEEPLSDNMPV